MKKVLPLDKAHRLISPRIAYIVTTVDKKSRVNAGVFSNLTSVSIDPERLILSVYKEWDTIKNIKATREFVVNIPSSNLVEKVWICGDKYAGNPIPRGVNELKVAGLTQIPSEKVNPPRVEECYGHLECKVVWIKDVGDHYLVLADIFFASFTEGFLDENFIVDVNKAQPLLEISRNMFAYPKGVLSINRAKISKKVQGELKKLKVRIPKKLLQYQKTVISEE